MAASTVLSVIESPSHPNFSALYQRLGIAEVKVTSLRQAIHSAKIRAPDFVVAEFFYGYGNNYAGVNISNLDVLLASLQRYAPHARAIVLVDKSERGYVDQLAALFTLHAVLVQPVRVQAIEPLLSM